MAERHRLPRPRSPLADLPAPVLVRALCYLGPRDLGRLEPSSRALAAAVGAAVQEQHLELCASPAPPRLTRGGGRCPESWAALARFVSARADSCWRRNTHRMWVSALQRWGDWADEDDWEEGPSEYSLAVDGSGRIHAMGGREREPGAKAQFGRAITALHRHCVVAVSAGRTSHVAVVTDGGALLTFGFGAHGRLGHGDEENHMLPRRVAALGGRRIVAATCGSRHTAALSDAGELFTFGAAWMGMLGHGDGDGTAAGGSVVAVAVAAGGGSPGSSALPVGPTWYSSSSSSSSSSSPSSTSSAAAVAAAVPPEQELLPRLVGGALAQERVTSMTTGFDFTVVVCASGRPYSFGRGDFGVLGHGDEENRLVPTLIEALAGFRVREVRTSASVHSAHTAVLTTCGRLFTFGCGECGQLGHGNTETQLLPRTVEALAGVRVRSVAVGGNHTVAITDDGVYTFGNGDAGKLGHGKLEGGGAAAGGMLLLPKRVPPEFGRVVKAACGKQHTALVTADGHMYISGIVGDGLMNSRTFTRAIVPNLS